MLLCMRVLTLAKKKETTMSQMTSLQNALKAAAKVRVLVKIATVTARKAQAPVGSGSRTSPVSEHSQLQPSVKRHTSVFVQVARLHYTDCCLE